MGMKVVALPRVGACEIITKPLPRIQRDYVMIKVLVAPMCNEHLAYSQWDFRDRNRPDSLGHEAAGEVVEVGLNSRFRPGDRVVALSGYPCGRCAMCVSGAYAHCADTEDPRTVCGSKSGECGFAQYIIKAEWLLLPIPESMSYAHASMACCGLGATFTAMENMGVREGDAVLVTGLGPVGLGAVINGVARGARVLAGGSSPYRQDLALELGAESVVNPRSTGSLAAVLELTDGVGPDFVIDCSALALYQRFGLDAVRRGGSVTFLGESGVLPIHIDQDLIQKGVTLRGSLDLYLPHVGKIFDVIARNGELIDKFITHEFPLEGVEPAWQLQLQRKCGKIILRPWD